MFLSSNAQDGCLATRYYSIGTRRTHSSSAATIHAAWSRRYIGKRMNYFAHALPFLDRPYFVAGTAVPDWLTVADRRCGCGRNTPKRS